MKITELIQRLDADARVELFELDLTPIRKIDDVDSHLYFHAGTSALGGPIVWQGKTYSPWPIQVEGFEMTTQGSLPRPRLKVANINGAIGALTDEFDDLVGAKLIRRETFAQYLDAVNFGSIRNLLFLSQDVDNTVYWKRSAMGTVVADAEDAPDGTKTATLLVPGSTYVAHYLSQQVSGVQPNTVHSFSVFLKSNGVPRAIISAMALDGSFTFAEVRFADGKVTSFVPGVGQPAGCHPTLESWGDGWYRVGIAGWNSLSGSNTPAVRVYAQANQGIGSAYWSSTGVVSTRGVVASPDPSWAGDSMVENLTTGGHTSNLAVRTIAGHRYQFTGYVKAMAAGAKRWLALTYYSGTATNGSHTAVFDPVTGAITYQLGSSITEVSCVPAQDGWYRVTFTIRATINSTGTLYMRLANAPAAWSSSWAGDGTSGLYIAAPYLQDLDGAPTDYPASAQGPAFPGDGVNGLFAWGAQFEQAASPTAYQPTGTLLTQNVTADPDQHFPDQTYFVERKVSSNKAVVEFELASSMDLGGFQLPARILVATYCPWTYRTYINGQFDYSDADCPYTGTAYFDVNDQPVTDPAKDVCSKGKSGCKARYYVGGKKATLPYGAFPAARIYRQ